MSPYKNAKTLKAKKIILLTLIGFFTILLGSAMRIMHWPMARFTVNLGAVLFVIGLIVLFHEMITSRKRK